MFTRVINEEDFYYKNIEKYKNLLEINDVNMTSDNRLFDVPPFPPFKNEKANKE